MAPPRLPLLLLVLLSEVPLAASGQEEDEVKDGVGFELGPADLRISSVSFPASNNQEECRKGYFKDRDSPEMCQKCSSCGDLTVLTECSPRSDTVCGSTGNSLPEWFAPVVSVLLLLACLVLVVAVYCYCKDQLCALWVRCVSCFRIWRQPKGPANEWNSPDVNNSSEVPPDPMNAENDQCNPEESDSLLHGGNSDSAWNSVISVVWEVMPQRGASQFPANCSDVCKAQ